MFKMGNWFANIECDLLKRSLIHHFEHIFMMFIVFQPLKTAVASLVAALPLHSQISDSFQGLFIPLYPFPGATWPVPKPLFIRI